MLFQWYMQIRFLLRRLAQLPQKPFWKLPCSGAGNSRQFRFYTSRYKECSKTDKAIAGYSCRCPTFGVACSRYFFCVSRLVNVCFISVREFCPVDDLPFKYVGFLFLAHGVEKFVKISRRIKSVIVHQYWLKFNRGEFV